MDTNELIYNLRVFDPEGNNTVLIGTPDHAMHSLDKLLFGIEYNPEDGRPILTLHIWE